MSRILLDIENGEFVLHVGALDHDLAKQIPGLSHHQGRWHGPLAWSTALATRGVFGVELALSDSAREWGQRQVADEQYVASLKMWEPIGEPAPLTVKQETAANLLVQRRAWGVFDDPGTGKGVVTAVALSRLEHEEFPAVIIAPSSGKGTHRDELVTHAPHLNPYVVKGTPTQRRKIIEAGLSDPRGVVIVAWSQLQHHSKLAAYGSISRSEKELAEKELNDPRIKTVLVDETHRGGNPNTKWTRAMWTIVHQPSVHRRWFTTGTPNPTPMAFWSIMHALMPREFPTSTKYRSRYTLSVKKRGKGGIEHDEVVGYNPRTEDELNRIADRFYIRRTYDTMMPGMPPLTYSTMWMEMESKQRKAYDDMRKHQLARLDSGLLVALDPMQTGMRLLQFASAMPVLGEPDPETGIPPVVSLERPSTKTAAVLEWIEEHPDDSLVVFASSRKLIELVGRTLDEKKPDVKWVEFTGNTNEEQRGLNVHTFQAGDAQLILLTYGAGSENITLTRAHTQLMLQRSWNPVENYQADRRTKRFGQEADHVHIIDVVTADSHDERAFVSGAFKDENAQHVLRDPEWVRKSLEAK